MVSGYILDSSEDLFLDPLPDTLIYLRGHFVKVPWLVLMCSRGEHHLLSCTSELNICEEWKLRILLISSFCLGFTIAVQGSGPTHLPMERGSWESTSFVINFPPFVNNLLLIFSATVFPFPPPTICH